MHDAALRARLRPRIVAHRGRSGAWPENAITSLRHLPPWVRRVEVDVRLSRDGIPVLMHDKTVDRTTDGRGAVAELDCAELEALKLAPDARVPTLWAYLEACIERGIDEILLHLKVRREEALLAALATVRSLGAQDRCSLLLRSATRALDAHAIAPDVGIGLLGTSRENLTERLALARRGAVSLLLTPLGDERYMSERAVVAAARAAGVRAGASTLRGEAAHRVALEDGCDVIVSDSADCL